MANVVVPIPSSLMIEVPFQRRRRYQYLFYVIHMSQCHPYFFELIPASRVLVSIPVSVEPGYRKRGGAATHPSVLEG